MAVTSPEPLLSLAAPIGMAASVASGLVVDTIGDLSLNTGRTLAEILADGPRLDELSPGRRGVAVIALGPVALDDALEAVNTLASSWPGVVVRAAEDVWPGPTVPVIPLYPGLLASRSENAAVWQPTGFAYGPPGPGPVLPGLGSRLARQLLGGQLPRRSRWIRAWARVWELPWA